MSLSPLTRSRLHDNEAFAIPVNDTISGLGQSRRFKCPVCDDLHKRERDAESCCPRDADEVWVHPKSGEVFHSEESLHEYMLAEADESICPVCLNVCRDTHDAANCCLWKDLDASARFRIANAVDAGKTWADALEITCPAS